MRTSQKLQIVDPIHYLCYQLSSVFISVVSSTCVVRYLSIICPSSAVATFCGVRYIRLVVLVGLTECLAWLPLAGWLMACLAATPLETCLAATASMLC